MVIHETAQIENSTLGEVMIREYVTIHDSTIGSDSHIYERVSIKKSEIGKSVDINANVTITKDIEAGTVVRDQADQ